MNKNDPIEINQVANGFLVRRPYNMSRGDCIGFDEMLVFRTLVELQTFLHDHFSHRAAPKMVDLLPPVSKEKKAA